MTIELIVRLDGGLGNQLFQYAAGYALARRAMAKLTLDLTPLLYTRHLARDYLLDRFRTDVEAMSKSPPELALIKLSGSAGGVEVAGASRARPARSARRL